MHYIFGGAFDPPTVAHSEIIRTIASIMDPKVDKLTIFVTNNTEKHYKAEPEERRTMTEILLANTKLPIPRDSISVEWQDELMAWELTHMSIKPTPEDTTLCIGLDQAEQLARGLWERSEEIRDLVSFLVFTRTTKNTLGIIRDRLTYAYWEKAKYKLVETEAKDVSSSAIRSYLERDPTLAEKMANGISSLTFEDIYRHIWIHELYYQNGPKYEENLEAFLAQYKIDKEKHGWAEPSVTADIVAYTSSEEVLLIRRKNYPFKNYWALPGGFFDLTDKDINYTAARELKEETHVDLPPEDFVQLKTYAHVFDPRLRVVDVAFSVRIPRDQEDKIGGDDDAAEAKLWPIWDLPKMAFHHKDIIAEHLKRKAAHDRQAN
jgi:8-oxo-dGTP diphosphatase